MNINGSNKGVISLLVFISSSLLINCSDSKSSAAETAVIGSAKVEQVGTSASDTLKKEEPKPLKFTSAREALDYMHSTGKWDEYAKGILPAMADENLEWCTKLLDNKYSRFIVVDKGKMKVILYNKYGVREKEYPMACSRNYGQKHGQWDSRTPEGFFSAQGIYDSSEWKFTNKNGYTSPAKGVYGKRFIRIKAPQTSSCGIHGTNAPGSIGRRASHGCVRVSNDNILDLVKYVEVGMPIIVNPGPKDRIANKRENCKSPWITTDATPGGYADSGYFGGDNEAKPKIEQDSVKTEQPEAPAVEPTVPDAENAKEEPTHSSENTPAE